MYIDLLARVLVILGGLYCLSVSLSMQMSIHKCVLMSIGIAALYLFFCRDYYLPFLGKCAIPVGVKKISINGDNSVNRLVKIRLTNLPPNTTVIYWAAQSNTSPSGGYTSPFDAYQDYSNSDIGKTDKDGNIDLQIQCPSPYTVSKFGFTKQLPQHVHYRYELPKYKGMMSRVYTKILTC